MIGQICSRRVVWRSKQLERESDYWSTCWSCKVDDQGGVVVCKAIPRTVERKRVEPSFRWVLLLDLGVVCSLLKIALSPSLLRNGHCRKVAMTLSSCVMKSRRKKSFSLLKIVTGVTNWLTIRILVLLFTGPCQITVLSYLLISSQGSESVSSSFRHCSLESTISSTRSWKLCHWSIFFFRKRSSML